MVTTKGAYMQFIILAIESHKFCSDLECEHLIFTCLQNLNSESLEIIAISSNETKIVKSNSQIDFISISVSGFSPYMIKKGSVLQPP